MQSKKRIAVVMGGRSPEHDVSVVTGLQILDAIDTERYDPFPVYIAPHGQWYIGDALRDRNNYIFSETAARALTPVTLDLSAKGKGILLHQKSGLLAKSKKTEFDVAIPAFHGIIGEDGGFQGLMELANIAYVGMRAKACAIFMDKVSTKKAFSGLGVPQLPYAAVERPENGLLVDADELEKLIEPIGYPCCLKPAHLGSSIGVGKATSVDEARSILSNIFKYDTKAIIEPFVQNLVEYNVALRVNADGETELSAIERPKSDKELLDFKEKYMAGGGGGKKTGTKEAGAISQGMLSLTRELRPNLEQEKIDLIQTTAVKIFEAYDRAGAPRIDFISNGETGEIWFNELNPLPGSFGYFLWEAAEKNVLFSDFLTDLIEEAQKLHQRVQIPHDPVPKDAQLLKRPR